MDGSACCEADLGFETGSSRHGRGNQAIDFPKHQGALERPADRINGKSSTEWTDPLVAKRTLALKQGPVGTAEEIRRLTFQSIKALLNVLQIGLTANRVRNGRIRLLRSGPWL